jgi:hypothetical protein
MGNERVRIGGGGTLWEAADMVQMPAATAPRDFW